MALLFIGILLHKTHEEDEQYGGRCDTDDDRQHHDSPTQVGTNSDISIPYGHLGNNLIVKAGNKGIQFSIDLTK